jgi:hypothetical protein
VIPVGAVVGVVLYFVLGRRLEQSPLSGPLLDPTQVRGKEQSMPIPLDQLAFYRPATALLPDVYGGAGTLNVLALLPDGLGQLAYNSDLLDWGAWDIHAVATESPYQDVVLNHQLHSYLVAIGWDDGTQLPIGFRVGPRMNGFIGYRITDDRGRDKSRVGTPFWVPIQPLQPQWNYSWDNNDDVPENDQGTDFDPCSGVHWFDGQNHRLSVFGATFRGQGAHKALREFFWDGQNWNWSDHGLPADWAAGIQIGPNSALWDQDRQNGYVFVAAVPKDRRRVPELFIRFCFRELFLPIWSWVSLGNPRPDANLFGAEMQEPLVVTRVEDGVFKINAMILIKKIDFVQQTQQWELWERYYDGVQWQDWSNHGPFPGSVPVAFDPFGQGPSPDFTLTTGVVWHDGDVPRINLFGMTADNSRLVEFFFDGNDWQFGFNIPGPNHLRFETASSAVLGKYITIVGRTENGEVWELFWSPQDPGFEGNWRFRRLFPGPAQAVPIPA